MQVPSQCSQRHLQSVQSVQAEPAAQEKDRPAKNRRTVENRQPPQNRNHVRRRKPTQMPQVSTDCPCPSETWRRRETYSRERHYRPTKRGLSTKCTSKKRHLSIDSHPGLVISRAHLMFDICTLDLKAGETSVPYARIVPLESLFILGLP